MADTPAMPSGVAEANADWLERALASRFPEAGPISATLLGETHGAATKLAYDITCANPGGGLPSRVWIKGGWEPHSAMMIAMGCYAREVWFYEGLAPNLLVPTPRGLYGATDGSGNGVVVMDDLILRGARLWTCAETASIDDVGSGVEALARLHAVDASIAAQAGIPLEPTVVGEAALAWSDTFDAAYLAKEISGERGAGMPEYARRPELVIAAHHALIAELRQRPEVLVHGDSHPGNTFTDHDGQVGFYDWQTISLSPWAFDISYFIVASLSVEDRRKAETELLRRYLDAFAAAGGTPPPWANAWRDYMKYIAYGLYIWMSVPHSYQLPAASTALTTRFSAASEDFDLFSLWGL